MPNNVQSVGEWRDGHLFVGNQLSLDFLNTDLIAEGAAVELLPDPQSLARWAFGAGLTEEGETERLGRAWRRDPRAGRATQMVKRYRDHLRAAVLSFEQGLGVPSGFLDELNILLRSRPIFRKVNRDDELGYVQAASFVLQQPDDLLGPLAEATMMLFTAAPAERIRKCEGCPVHFLDISKKGSRRWCSMNLCGNRIKVAAYQRRKRANRAHAE